MPATFLTAANVTVASSARALATAAVCSVSAAFISVTA